MLKKFLHWICPLFRKDDGPVVCDHCRHLMKNRCMKGHLITFSSDSGYRWQRMSGKCRDYSQKEDCCNE